MQERLKTSLEYATYHSALAVGILLLPFALALNALGIQLPYHRVLERLQPDALGS